MAAYHFSTVQWNCWLQLVKALTVLALAVLAGSAAADVQAATTRNVLVQKEAVVYYCVAKPNADSSKLQDALDWACGDGNSMGSVDCSAIQSGGSCFEPDTVADHASYAFTLYFYHQGAASQACNFSGLATLSTTNPSTGTCVYPTSQASASSSSSPDNSLFMPPPTDSSLPFLSSPAPSPSGAPGAMFALCLCPFVCLLLPLAIMALQIH